MTVVGSEREPFAIGRPRQRAHVARARRAHRRGRRVARCRLRSQPTGCGCGRTCRRSRRSAFRRATAPGDTRKRGHCVRPGRRPAGWSGGSTSERLRPSSPRRSLNAPKAPRRRRPRSHPVRTSHRSGRRAPSVRRVSVPSASRTESPTRRPDDLRRMSSFVPSLDHAMGLPPRGSAGSAAPRAQDPPPRSRRTPL